jgi:hypothetical protein
MDEVSFSMTQYRMLEIGFENQTDFLNMDRFTAPRNLEVFAGNYNMDQLREIFFKMARQLLFDREDATFKISEKGILYFTREKERREKLALESHQDKIKKWYETENAKTAFEDYPRVKRNATIAIWLSVATILITVLIELLKK